MVILGEFSPPLEVEQIYIGPDGAGKKGDAKPSEANEGAEQAGIPPPCRVTREQTRPAAEEGSPGCALCAPSGRVEKWPGGTFSPPPSPVAPKGLSGASRFLDGPSKEGEVGVGLCILAWPQRPRKGAPDLQEEGGRRRAFAAGSREGLLASKALQGGGWRGGAFQSWGREMQLRSVAGGELGLNRFQAQCRVLKCLFGVVQGPASLWRPLASSAALGTRRPCPLVGGPGGRLGRAGRGEAGGAGGGKSIPPGPGPKEWPLETSYLAGMHKTPPPPTMLSCLSIKPS